MNITLSVDEQIAQRAREAAQKMGKSRNQAVRDYLAKQQAALALLKQLQATASGVLYSEDMNAGEVVDGVQIVNPFVEVLSQ
jgi:predicted nucleic acid-binding protein